MNQKIAIIGCGWLGLPLAKLLIKKGYKIHGSTTSKDKIERLEISNISAFLLRFSSEGIEGNIKSCLSDCQTLILNIPPGLRKNPEHNYVQQMKHVLKHVEASSVKHIVFISSTSIYDDDATMPNITETSPTSSSNKASQLLDVETLFQNNKNFETTLLRFSGLFSEDRHPARFLSGKTNLKNADAPINLIHRDDCLGIISKLLEHNIRNAVFNASTTPHPTKKEYYTSVCKRLQIPIPKFEKHSESKGKIIDSKKLVRVLNYDFKIKL